MFMLQQCLSKLGEAVGYAPDINKRNIKHATPPNHRFFISFNHLLHLFANNANAPLCLRASRCSDLYSKHGSMLFALWRAQIIRSLEEQTKLRRSRAVKCCQT